MFAYIITYIHIITSHLKGQLNVYLDFRS